MTDWLGDIAPIAQKIEVLGFDSMWLPEHVLIPVHTSSIPPSYPDGIPPSMAHTMSPFVALARASAVTSRLKLGTAVCLVPEHNPIELAKQIATLDMYSGGRFMFGIGAGWLKEETEIMGGDFEHRWTHTREAVLAMKELWTKDVAEFHGRYVDFPQVRCNPKPAQKPHPPVILGGVAENVFKRVARWGDGWIPIRITPEQVKQGRVTLNELASERGRDPKSIEITVHTGPLPAEPDLPKRYEEAGADRMVIRVQGSDQESVLIKLDELATQVLD